VLQRECVNSQSIKRVTALSIVPCVPSVLAVQSLLLRMRRCGREEVEGGSKLYEWGGWYIERRAAHLKSVYIEVSIASS
jgi:hypothetical protein